MKLVFIGPSNIHKVLASMEPDWDFQEPIESVDEFIEEISKEEGSRVASDTSVILLFSRLFNRDRTAFARAVAFYAPHAAVGVLIPSMDREPDEELIKQEVSRVERNEELNPNSTPFYFIAYENPARDLFNALINYAQLSNGGEYAQAEIKKVIPERHFVTSDEQFEEYNDTYGYDDGEIHIPDAKGNGKVIAVTSSKGGSGKSTVSLLLGTYLAHASEVSVEEGKAEDPLRVCLVDLDTRDGQLGFLNGKTSPSIVNILEAASTEDEDVSVRAVEAGIYSSPNLKVDFVFAVKRPRHAKNISASFYAGVIQRLREMYDVIILDTSVNYLDELLEKVAYPLADQILFVTDMGISSIYGMARWVKENTDPIEEGGSGIDRNKIGVVVNKALDKVNITERHISQAADGLEILAFLPSKPTVITYAANSQVLNQVLRDPYLNGAFKDLAESVMGDDYDLGDVPHA